MAYVKIKCVKSGTHLQQVIDYIQNPEKTENNILISSYMCSTKNTVKQFEEVAKYSKHYGNNLAHHICQSFSPEDNITPQKALEIGQEMMKRLYPNHQYVMATHIDRNHIHNHFLVNAVDFENHKKFRNNLNNLKKMRSVSDDLCRENNLSVIVPEEKNNREKLKKVIDEAIKNSNTFDEFLGYMQFQKYEIKQGKYLYFKGEKNEVFFNTKLLGTAYTEKNIKKRIVNHTELKNHKIHIYDDKIFKMSYRKRLKLSIDNTLKTAKDYNDFLKILRSEDYEIKFGKHLAFKHITGSRYIRVESLGMEYSEEMLKLYFSDNEEYQSLKTEIEETKVDKIIVSDKAYQNKYIESKNVDIQIRILNCLSEKGIKSIEELKAKLEKCQKQADINNQNIQNINTQISEKKEIIKSRWMYWQYKPVIAELWKIKSLDEREKFKAENQFQIDKYNKAVEIMNRSQNPNGTALETADLNIEIERLETLKNNILIRQNRVKAELSSYENLKYNIERILDNNISNEHKERKKENTVKREKTL